MPERPMRIVRIVLAVWLAQAWACGPGRTAGSGGEAEEPTPVAVEADDGESAAGDAPTADEIRIAAIERAVNETRAAQHECWAYAAADDFHLAGAMVLRLTMADPGGGRADVEVIVDEPGDERLSLCIAELFRQYLWPEVFEPGQAIELPLSFHAPRGQYTVATRYVEPRIVANGAQAGAGGELRVAVLLHEQNTGNGAASLSRLGFTGDVEMRLHRHLTSTEILYVERGSITVVDHRGKGGLTVSAGEAVYFAAGTIHGVAHRGPGPTSVVQLFAPAGPEIGLDRARPADTELVDARELARMARYPKKKPLRPVFVDKPAEYAIAGGKARVSLYFDKATTGHGAAYLGILTAQPGARVPAHRHAKESEYLLVLEGSASMTVAGESYAVPSETAVQIPANLEHSVSAEGQSPLVAIQFYTPSGPEQRFKQP